MQALITAATKVIIILLMVSMGLRLAMDSLTMLWHRPKMLLREIVAAFVIVPVFIYLVFQIVPLSFQTRAGLFVLAIAPGAPMIGTVALRRSLCDQRLAASFQVTMALLVIVFAPLWLVVASALTGSSYQMHPLAIMRQVSLIQFVPILLGLLIHRRWPVFAARMGAIVEKTGMAALTVLILVIILSLARRMVISAEGWEILAAMMMAIAAVAAGHYLAGSSLPDRVTVATANAQRNVGLALAIIAWNLPRAERKAALVMIIYILMAVVVQSVYLKIVERRNSNGQSD